MGSLSSRNYILKMMKNRVLPVLALGLMMLLTSCGKEGVDPEEADRKNTGEFTYYSTIPVLGTCHKKNLYRLSAGALCHYRGLPGSR